MVNLDELRSVSIIGDIHSCKTNLAVKILRDYKGTRQIYLVGYPKQIDNFKQITFFNDLFKLTDSIIFIDEIQNYVNIYDRRRVQDFIQLLSFFAHNNNTLIFTTCLSQFIPKRLEPYLDCWCLTKIMDINGLKNGGKPKRIIQNTTHPRCTKWSLALKKGEYIEHSELNEPEDNGLKTFEDQHIEKDWRIEAPNITIIEKCPKKCPEKCPENPPLKRLLKKTFEEKLQEIVQDESPVEVKVSNEEPRPAKKDLTNDEISKLAWGGLRK